MENKNIFGHISVKSIYIEILIILLLSNIWYKIQGSKKKIIYI